MRHAQRLLPSPRLCGGRAGSGSEPGAPRGRRPAFTLVEILVVMAGLGVAVAFGTVLILTTLKAEHTAEAAADRISGRQELVRQFRDDVNQAESAPDKLGDLADLSAGPACLILQMPKGSTIIYQWQKENNKLERIVRTGDKETRSQAPIGLKETSVEFVRPAKGKADVDVFTLRLSEPQKIGAARRSDISAALGGNLR